MTEVSPPEDWLTFPDSPAFHNKPSDLVPFEKFTPLGIYVPKSAYAKLIAPVPAPSKHRKPAPTPTPAEDDDADDLLGSAPEEFDGDGNPTLPIKVEHSLSRWGGAKGRANQKVTRVDKASCFVLGKEAAPGAKEWVEPAGTCKGEWPLTKSPFDRALRALTQYFNSRSLALNRGHYMFARYFRRVTRLQVSNQGPHLPGSEDLYTYSLEFVMPGEEKESSPFIRDMVGCLRSWWAVIMEEAGEGWNFTKAYNCIEIVNSFLHYLQLHQLLPEPILASHLSLACTLSSRAIHQICATLTILSSQAAHREGWQAVCAAAWAPGKGREKEWEDEGWRRLGDEEWDFEDVEGAVARAKKEKERREEEKMLAAEAKTEEEERKRLEAEGKKWSEGDVAHEHLRPLIKPLLPSNYKVIQDVPRTTLVILSAATATAASAPFACLEGLVEMTLGPIKEVGKGTEIKGNPKDENEKNNGDVEIDQMDPSKAKTMAEPEPASGSRGKPAISRALTLYLDPGKEMLVNDFIKKRVMEEMTGMKVLGRWVEVEIGEGETAKRVWIVVDIKKVSPNL